MQLCRREERQVTDEAYDEMNERLAIDNEDNTDDEELDERTNNN